MQLSKGLLRPARQKDYITRLTTVAPAETPDCPRWLEFLKEITSGNTELVAFLQRWFGYCLTGNISEESLLFVFGPGGNGKTVLLNTIAHIMGDYATMAPIDTFTASQYRSTPPTSPCYAARAWCSPPKPTKAEPGTNGALRN